MIQILQTDLAATKTRLTALENAQHQAVSGRAKTMAAETRILLLCTIVLSTSPVTTQTTWDDVTDLDTVIDRLVEKKMETMTWQLEDRLTQQQARRDKELLGLLERHVQDKERLEERVREQGELLGKLQDQLLQERKEEERKMKILTQRIEVLELQVKVNMAEGQDKQTHGVVTPEDDDGAEEASVTMEEITFGGPTEGSDDVGSLQPVINHMTQQLNEVTADVQALKNANVLNEQARGHGAANLYGAEYETCDEPECDLTPVCAVCRVPRAAVVMVPGKNTCWPEWTLEYSGYRHGNRYPSGTRRFGVHLRGQESWCV
nr:hypothetical protein BaRGS_023116 [Batillaria attramentaria]